MAIRIYYNGEELDEIGIVLCAIIILSVLFTIGLIAKHTVWGC